MYKNNYIVYLSRRFCTTASSISNIYTTKNIGDKVTIKGWIRALRRLKENTFVDVSDGSSSKNLQALISSAHKPHGLSIGCSVSVSGVLNMSPKGQLELQADDFKVHGACNVEDGYPFLPKKSYPPEYLRQYLPFRPRTHKFSTVLRIRDYTALAIHNNLHEEGYVQIHTPILTSNDCEGAGEVFTVVPDNQNTLRNMAKTGIPMSEAYFNSKVFLTVSGQLHLEATAHSLSKVYSFGPTFRAENSKSRLHLSEFYMLEAECAFLNKLEQVTGIVEKLVKDVTKKVVDKYSEDIEKFKEQEISFSWIDKRFILLTYDEAVAILEKNKGKYAGEVNKQKGLIKEHELFLVKYCDNVPIFITNWPKDLKPFYAKCLPEDSTKVAAFDLLVPIVGEVVGGSLREDSYEILKEKLPEGTDLDWYLNIRKFGGVPTGGFGLGFERYMQFILGINNIKDTIPFPRWPHNCKL